MEPDIVDDLKQSEYTGENRCEPCTVLNLGIAAVASAAIARKSRVGGLLAAAVSIALISLRGYLVPGTPTLTKRYLPPEVLRWFGKDPEPAVASGLGPVDTGSTDAIDTARSAAETDAATGPGEADDATADNEADATETPDADDATVAASNGGADRAALDLETFFREHDVLEPCSDRDDLCLTDDFEVAWFDEIEPLAEGTVGAPAAVDAFGFDADQDAFELETRGESRALLSQSRRVGRWPSRAALIADVAASRTLESWVDDWAAFGPETKGEVLNGLRMFLETCPSGGDVVMGEEVVESCCSSHEVVAVTCEETGERLFEQRLADVDA
nr:hypothetical protein [Natrinema versiforme]